MDDVAYFIEIKGKIVKIDGWYNFTGDPSSAKYRLWKLFNQIGVKGILRPVDYSREWTEHTYIYISPIIHIRLSDINQMWMEDG